MLNLNIGDKKMTNKKEKVFVLEIFFKNENDLKTFVEEHWNENGHSLAAKPKDGFDLLHLKDYTKKVYNLKPTDKMDSMAHLWLKPKSNMTWKEQLQAELKE